MSNTTTAKTASTGKATQADKPLAEDVLEGVIVGDGEIATGKESKGEKKAKGFDENKDWSYLADKDPSDAQAIYAATMSKLSGVQITPKQFQVMISMHRWVQQSEVNKSRPDYRGRTLESVIKGSETLANRVDQRITNGESPESALSPNSNAVNAEVVEEVQKALASSKAPAKAPAKVAPKAAPKKAEVVVEAPKPAPRQRRKPAAAPAEVKANA